MPRKIYDVKPPKLVKQVEEGIKEFLGEDKKKKTTKTRRKKENISMRPFVFLFVLIVVLILGVFLYFKLQRATVQIWPKVDTLSFKQVVVADKTAQVIDPSKFLIPGKYFEVSKTDSQDFPATGNASNEGLATGTITIYNKYSPVMPFTLKAGTRFLSDSGKLFTSLQKVVVPAAKKVGSKITPGSIEITVQAAEGGEAYNIAPANFSVPGLKGTAYYYSIYATSAKAMTGGYAGKVKKVTDDDIQAAKDALVKKATDEAKEELKKQIPSEYVLLENAVSSETVDSSTETKVGTVAEKFNYKATVKVSAMTFKKSDAEQFAKEYLVSQLEQGETLLDSSFDVKYSSSSIDVSGGKETLSLEFSSGAYKDVDKNSMALSLMGKNNNQINETINNILGDQVSKVKINFWPFWTKLAPKSQNGIKVELKF